VHALATEGLSGPVNVAAPGEVRQGDFARALGRALHRPACVPAPRFAMRALLGREQADEVLLASARVRPAALIASEFRFAYPMLDAALGHVLGVTL
jgi:NAD dependent epimerase/dehydratase family enzyme